MDHGALLLAAALAATPSSALAGCPQERAVYSLGDATLTFEPNQRSRELGWGAVLRAPSTPIRLYATVSNGIARAYFISEQADWLMSPIEGNVGTTGQSASQTLTIPNFGPKGVWRLTGCR